MMMFSPTQTSHTTGPASDVPIVFIKVSVVLTLFNQIQLFSQVYKDFPSVSRFSRTRPSGIQQLGTSVGTDSFQTRMSMKVKHCLMEMTSVTNSNTGGALR